MSRKKETQRVYMTGIRKDVIIDKCGGKCMRCGKKVSRDSNFTVEHFIPISKGGTNELSNLVALCEDCNKDKGNDVVYPKWYKAAPKVVKKELEEGFDEYLDRCDWLTNTNLLMVDRFDAIVNQAIINPKSGKVFTRPTECEIRKVKYKQETVNYLENYKKILSEDDRDGIIKNVDEVDVQFYRMDYKGKTVFYFSLEIREGDVAQKNFRNAGQLILFFDIFINPDIKFILNTQYLILDAIHEVVNEVARSVRQKGTKCVLPLYLRCMSSDPRGNEILGVQDELYGSALMSASSGKAELTIAVCYMNLLGEDKDPEDADKLEKRYRGQLSRRLKKNA